MPLNFNDTPFNLVLKKGLAANLFKIFTAQVKSTTFLQEAEPAWTTDEKRLYITDASNNHVLVGPPANQSIQVNGIWSSDSYDIWVNTRDLSITVNSTLGNAKPVFVNGV